MDNKKHNSQQSVNQAIKAICDIMRRANFQGAMQYVPELTWILFLRILDEMETQDAENAKIQGKKYPLSLKSPYRWCDWAAPYDEEFFKTNPDNKTAQGWKRYELQKIESVKNWVNAELIPYLKNLKHEANASQRQKVISEIMSGVQGTRLDGDTNLLEIFDKIHTLSHSNVDDQHVFALSQVYEGLLLSMGEKGNDGGQFFTPREVIRMMIKTINPQIGQTIYDPCCGTGGFLAQAMEFMAGKDANGNLFAGKNAAEIRTLKHKTFYGWEKDNQVYPIALANLILHSIDLPQLCHGNTLLEEATYKGLFQNAPTTFDVILTNPPFGGKEGKRVKEKYKTGATQICFLQHVQEKLNGNGQCAIVIDEGVLFRTSESGFVDTKRRLLNECNVWCIVSLPGGVFTNAGAGVKTNVLFFTKGKPTEKIWYYDCSAVKVGKRTPFTLEHFNHFFELLPTLSDSEKSWTIDFKQRKQNAQKQATTLDKLADEKRKRTAALKTQLKNQRKQMSMEALIMLKQSIEKLEKEVNELDAKAKTISNAIYDLKAVNPNITEIIDNRTPKELIDFIAQQGHEVTRLLKQLQI